MPYHKPRAPKQPRKGWSAERRAKFEATQRKGRPQAHVNTLNHPEPANEPECQDFVLPPEADLEVDLEAVMGEPTNPTLDDLLAVIQQQQETINALERRLDRQEEEETQTQYEPDFDYSSGDRRDPNELVTIWVSDKTEGIVKETMFDPESNDTYLCFKHRIQGTRWIDGDEVHFNEVFTIPVNVSVEVPRFVYDSLNENVIRASLVQSR